jgi:hypothetical protein
VNRFVVSGNLAQDEEVCYRLSVKLDADTPDAEQGASITFVLHLQATQPDNPSWP